MDRDKVPQPEIDLAIHQAIDRVLDAYAAVEPAPGVVRAWIERSPQPPRRSLRSGPFGAAVPAWAVLAAVLLLILGIGWYRLRERSADTRARLAAGEHAVLTPLPPSVAPPLTRQQKQLLQLLQTNPAALATQQPEKKTQPRQ